METQEGSTLRNFRLELINALEPKVLAIGRIFKNHPIIGKWGDGNDFSHWDGRSRPRVSFDSDGIRFRFIPGHDYATVKIYNTRAHETLPSKIVISPASFDESKSRVISLIESSYTNDTDTPVNRKVTWKKGELNTTASAIARDVSTRLLTAVEVSASVGGVPLSPAMVESSVRTELEVTSAFRAETSESSKRSVNLEIVEDFVCPARKALEITKVVNMEEGSLDITRTGFQNFSVEIWSHNDFTARLNGIGDLLYYLSGFGDSEIPLSDEFRRSPVIETNEDIIELTKPPKFSRTVSVDFDRALSERLVATELEISDTPPGMRDGDST